jgi:hypothetical protein
MKLDDDQLLEMLRRKEDAASAYVHGELGEEREKSLREYHRMPYGNEEEGWSQIVTSDIQDTIEWVLPDLLDIFSSTDRAVEFEPSTAEDVEGAEQATDCVNYVFHKQNNGFLFLYTAIKEMLMLRNCAAHWYKQTSEVVSSKPFQNATPEMLAMLLKDGGEIEQANEQPMQGPDGQPVIGMDGQPVMVISGRIKSTEKKTIVKVEAFSCHELLVERDWTSPLLENCPYVCRLMRVTVSDLHNMGFKDVTASDMRDDEDSPMRLRTADRPGDEYAAPTEEADDSTTEGTLRIEYILADDDGDGIAERLCVYRLEDRILKREVVSCVQIATASPILNPHRWDGMSMADIVADLQVTHTELLRQTLNNLYLTNNPRTAVLSDSNGTPYANIDDLLDNRAGGILRYSRPDALQQIQTPFAAGASLPMLEYIQGMRENRTGVSRESMGLHADSLNNTATGRKLSLNSSQKRIKLIARIIAEILLKPVFAGILKELTDGGMEKLAFRLRGKFVQYDPNEWRDQYDMTINVGLGTGNGEEQIAKLTMIYQAQVAGMGMGLAHPSHIYHTQTKMAEAAGYKDVQNFFAEPPEGAMPPPQDPAMQIEQMKLQADQQKFQAEHQMNAAIEQLKAQAKQQESQMQLELQASNDARDGEREQFKAEQQARIEQAKIDAALREADIRAETDRYKADLDAQVKLQIAGLQAQQQRESQEMSTNAEFQKLDRQAQHTEQAKKPDDSVSKGLASLQKELADIKAHNTAPRKKLRDASGKLIGVEINGTVVPIEG